MKKKKYIIIAIIACCTMMVLFSIKLLSDYNEMIKFGKKCAGIYNIEDKENRFEKEPTLKLAFHLMEKYKHVETIRNMNKVKFYGKKAIELGANNKLCGFFVNIWLASVYHEEGNDLKACNFFNKAIELQNPQRNNVISDKLLQEEGLSGNFTEYCQTLNEQKKLESKKSSNY